MTPAANPDIEGLVRQLADQHFYGSLTLKFEAGRIVILKKEETLKPHDLSGQPKTQHNENYQEK